MKNNKLSYVIFFLVLLFASCNNGQNVVYEDQEQEVKAVAQNNIVTDTTILRVEKVHADTTDLKFYDKCIDWSLSKKQIKEVLGLSKVITGHEFHYLYYVLPCHLEGELTMNGVEYEFNLNSGSFIHLQSSDTSFYMGCADKKCEPFFLEKGGVFDEGND